MELLKTAIPGPIMEWLQHWWPALLCLLVVYFGWRFIIRPKGLSRSQLDALGFAVHEIRTTLACSEIQAKKLLAIYGGNATKAINEIKTGRAVLPGEEVSDLAIFGGEFRSFQIDDAGFALTTQDERVELLDLESPSLLVVGVIDSEQRPDKRGVARADRGQTYGQLFWRKEGEWNRYLLNSTRLDYFRLGERKEASAIRNFRIMVTELTEKLPQLSTDTSVTSLKDELKATHYRTLAEFEAAASQLLRNWSGQV
jgi:hypothetical protein